MLTRIQKLLLVLAVCAVAVSPAFGSVTITILNNDGPNTGFNDSTPATPVGGNSGTTVGAQRLIAFNFAASIWGAQLNSSQAIVIRADWPAQSCSANSGVLGSAGTNNIFSDFPGAPFSGTWYSTSLANALSGSDRNGASPEINAHFNVNIGTTGCLENSPWYYGLDNNHGNGTDLVSVLLHEFSHGFGFQTFTSSATGEFNAGLPSIYDRFLRDNTTGTLWVNMTAAERQASAINDGNLVWAGPQVMADAPNVLGSTPRLRVNSPPAIARSYTVGTATFGPGLTSPGITNSVAASSPVDGCTAIGGSVSGKIAFIDRGSCNFTVKVKNAQNAGAIAVIIGNVASSANNQVPPNMGGTDPTITIPSVSLALDDADALRAQLGNSINATILLDLTALAGADSSNRVLMYAPNPREAGSSVSHFDPATLPNQLMEPNISNDLTHNVSPPQDLTFSLFRDLGWNPGAVVGPTVQLTSSSFGAVESIGSMLVSVGRNGDTSAASTVEYATGDNAGASACNLSGGSASSRCDYLQTIGKLTFAPGETTKTILIPIVDDVFVDGPTETFSITLSNPTNATLGTANATLSINDNDSSLGVNPIDDATFFVRQHYIDFLNREPDTAGLNFWTNEITSCGANPQCIEVKRINVSAAFFLSIEFQQTGYFVERVYKTAYGNATGNSTLGGPHTFPVPIIRLHEFLADKQLIGDGVIVGQTGWEALLEQRKNQYVADFVQRTRFTTEHPTSLTPTEFVDRLNTNAGNPLSPTERSLLVMELTNGSRTRAQVLRAIAEDSDLVNAEVNRAFVLAQFFGYLRRNPNDLPDSDYTGYDFWLLKLNQFNGNFVNAEMVKAFILSGEYRHRFGS